MKIFLMISILLMSCTKSERYYSENCEIIDSVEMRGHKTFGYRRPVTLDGTYTYEIYRCSIPTLKITVNDSIPITFDPDIRYLK